MFLPFRPFDVFRPFVTGIVARIRRPPALAGADGFVLIAPDGKALTAPTGKAPAQ